MLSAIFTVMVLPSKSLSYLFLLLLLHLSGTAAKKAKEQLQNILAHTFGESGVSESKAEPLVLPWKKPNTVIHYSDILSFNDELEIIDNHICTCRLEGSIPVNLVHFAAEYKSDSIGADFEGAL